MREGGAGSKGQTDVYDPYSSRPLLPNHLNTNNMSWQAILPLLTFGLGGGSNLAGSIINREQSRGDIDRQNEYNAPINQIKRLREAGLPMAAGFQGGVSAGSQSALPQTSGQGIAQGAASAVQNFITTSMNLKQLELLNAQTVKTYEEAQKVANENQIYTSDPFAAEAVSYGARSAKLDVQYKQLQNDMGQNRYEIEKIDYDVKKQLHQTGHLTGEVRQRVLNMFWQMQGMMQVYRTTEMRTAAERRLIQSLEEGGLSVGEAFIHMLMTGGLKNFTPMNN